MFYPPMDPLDEPVLVSSPYVGWEEVIICNVKKHREVHYFLKKRVKDIDGDGGGEWIRSDLAVIGEERTVRHMSYKYVLEEIVMPKGFKLKSRREVIEWLDSVVQVQVQDLPSRGSSQADDGTMDNDDIFNSTIPAFKDLDLRRSVHRRYFKWIGSSSTCKKRRRHYQSFARNDIVISVQDFVYVLAEKNKRLVAYVEDLYEDSRGNKRVTVRWFHKIDEVGLVLPPNINDREIFSSLSLQDLSAECIDGLATVLGPQHFDIYLTEAIQSSWEPFFCDRQFDNGEITAFDITQMQGYLKQRIFNSLHCSDVGDADDYFDTRPKRRPRMTRCKSSNRHMNGESEVLANLLPVDAYVEVLSQDSGIQGCWFTAVILKKNKDRVKVRYEDIEDAEDEAKHLEEWIFASRIAHPDKSGLRLCGRTTIRPCPLSSKCEIIFGSLDVGTCVDAWWHDGWWEGIVVRCESENRVHVYFPGEQKQSIFGCSDLRCSQDWVSNKWSSVGGRPDFVSSVLSSLENTEDADSPVLLDNQFVNSCHVDALSPNNERDLYNNAAAFSDHCNDNKKEKEVVPNLAKDNFLDSLKWSVSRKRRRVGERSHKKGSLASSSSSQEDLGLGRDSESPGTEPPSVLVDPEICKYQDDFVITSSIPPLSMIMSR